jgi:hypothetical protein
MTPYTEISELDNGVLKCKYYRTHAWEENPAVDISNLPTVHFATYVITSVCLRCGRERIEYIDRKGHRIGKPYLRNPVGYPKTHYLDGDTVRAEVISRSLLIRNYNHSERSRRGRR